MGESKSYCYFALKGDDFDPAQITSKIGIKPTSSCRKGDKGEYIPYCKYSSWELSTEKGHEPILIDNLVSEIIEKLENKIEIINQLKDELKLSSVIEIILDIDINEEQSTPALGHDLRTINFLYKTQTITDVDIYRYNSLNEN